MANTVYGPYAPTTWVDGTTVGNQTRMNNIEKQASIGLNGFNGDLLTPFVLSGLVCTKDGTIANQLDVTAGRVYIQMTDGTVGLIVTAASVASEFLTATPSTTYYLDLNPDGSWSWSTSHSAVTHHLTICSVTTDGSGNISVVTDARTLNTALLAGMGGSIGVPGILSVGAAVGGQNAYQQWYAPGNEYVISSPLAGSANGVTFQTWNGSAAKVPFSVGGQFAGAASWVDDSGIFTIKPPNYDAIFMYAINTAYYASIGFADASFGSGAGFYIYDHKNNGFVMSAGTSGGVTFGGNISGPAGGGVPTTRNGAASSVPIYTGTTTPTGNGTTTPATGALWAKA